jgi:hypothetical protein
MAQRMSVTCFLTFMLVLHANYNKNNFPFVDADDSLLLAPLIFYVLLIEWCVNLRLHVTCSVRACVSDPTFSFSLPWCLIRVGLHVCVCVCVCVSVCV